MYIPGTTCLHIHLAHPCLYYYLLSPQYTVLHIVFYCTFCSLFFLISFYLYLSIFSCVVLHILHFPLSGPDLTYISLLIIFCITEYVTNKNLNPDLDTVMRDSTIICRTTVFQRLVRCKVILLKYIFVHLIRLWIRLFKQLFLFFHFTFPKKCQNDF